MQIFRADFQICMFSSRKRRAGGKGRERRRRRLNVELADTETAESFPRELIIPATAHAQHLTLWLFPLK